MHSKHIFATVNVDKQLARGSHMSGVYLSSMHFNMSLFITEHIAISFRYLWHFGLDMQLYILGKFINLKSLSIGILFLLAVC